MTPAIRQLIDALDAHAGPIGLEALEDAMRQVNFSRGDLSGHVKFSPDTYRRNRVHRCEHYEVMVLCWHSGQRSPVHDHGDSACGLTVVEGTATETFFARSASGLAFPTASRQLHAGDTAATFGRDIHQLGNLGAKGQDLISLHVYSPPLPPMCDCRLDDALDLDLPAAVAGANLS
jgi:cysteine dioxygenase